MSSLPSGDASPLPDQLVYLNKMFEMDITNGTFGERQDDSDLLSKLLSKEGTIGKHARSAGLKWSWLWTSGDTWPC